MGYEPIHVIKMPFAIATKLGIPSIIIEAGGGVEIKYDIVETVVQGIINTLKYLQILKGEVEWQESYNLIERYVDLKSKHGGLFQPSFGEKRPPFTVSEGKNLGSIRNLFGDIIYEVRAPFPGRILSVCRARPFVSTGVNLFHYAELGKEIRR